MNFAIGAGERIRGAESRPPAIREMTLTAVHLSQSTPVTGRSSWRSTPNADHKPAGRRTLQP